MIAAEYLEGNLALKGGVEGLEDLSHAALAEESADLETPPDPAGHGLGHFHARGQARRIQVETQGFGTAQGTSTEGLLEEPIQGLLIRLRPGLIHFFRREKPDRDF